MANYWLTKSEPDVYSWDRLVAEGRTVWDGVRNFQARNNLRAMKKGDLVLYYHSGDDKSVVGIAKVVREGYPDPSAKEGDWTAVELAPVRPFKEPVTLSAMKADKKLTGLALIKHSRLSVVPIGEAHFARILELGKTKA
ncbi:MAG TPA: EVE domain-containing protein [Polyangiaceae bacterium]|jgi:predicted RNA-binding protein with PUA-like domain|nr:EVE domain-containing protein [Polyangiaceae bacterium]